MTSKTVAVITLCACWAWVLFKLCASAWKWWVNRDSKPALPPHVEAEILAAYEQRNAQILAEMLRQRTCILANQRGERFWRS